MLVVHSSLFAVKKLYEIAKSCMLNFQQEATLTSPVMQQVDE